eukprot:4223617-Pyramimonas_sp.AAC.2
MVQPARKPTIQVSIYNKCLQHSDITPAGQLVLLGSLLARPFVMHIAPDTVCVWVTAVSPPRRGSSRDEPFTYVSQPYVDQPTRYQRQAVNVAYVVPLSPKSLASPTPYDSPPPQLPRVSEQ